MPESRRLILHIGAVKTGTSAIQIFLASNVEPLRNIGLDYLNAEPPRAELPTIGNGRSIFLYFSGAKQILQKLQSLLNGYFGTQRTAIISSETLSTIPLDWLADPPRGVRGREDYAIYHLLC